MLTRACQSFAYGTFLRSLHADVVLLEASSPAGEDMKALFSLTARSIYLSIDGVDPEKAGNVVSCGDRALRSEQPKSTQLWQSQWRAAEGGGKTRSEALDSGVEVLLKGKSRE